MITDIPSPDEFEMAGVDFLNIAWDSTCDLLLHLDSSDIETWDIDGEAVEQYWGLAQRALTKSLALVHQGIELIIKARITKISPFLIISGKPSEWPQKCNIRNTPFSSFKTINASEIVKVYNTVSSNRLTEDFIAKYENLRKARNSIMHSVNKQIKVHAKNILVAILDASDVLIGPHSWIQQRKDYLENLPYTSVAAHDYTVDILYCEIDKVIEILYPSLVKKYLNFNKKQRRYYCPNCAYLSENESPNLAQLEPNNPRSRNIYCILCGKNTSVLRKLCKSSICKGNVMSKEDNTCCICGKTQQKEIKTSESY